MKHWFWLLVMAAALPLLAKGKKPSGDVLDPRSFANIRSYCVDTRDLADNERYQVEGFVDQESKPKKLLTQLPWKLFTDCREGEPDAVIKIEFQRLKDLGIRLGEQERDPTADSPREVYRVKAVLRVSDADSKRLVYQVQGSPLENSSSDSPLMAPDAPSELRHSALYHAFWALVQDTQLLLPAGSK
jgi:hypothetical protein